VTSSCLKAGCFLGFRHGLPCVSFGYQTEAKANAGRNHVMAALNGAEEVWLKAPYGIDDESR
jgi:hypothetical protein